eukprot:7520290-Alexandrium_andersonii.AAC.1
MGPLAPEALLGGFAGSRSPPVSPRATNRDAVSPGVRAKGCVWAEMGICNHTMSLDAMGGKQLKSIEICQIRAPRLS